MKNSLKKTKPDKVQTIEAGELNEGDIFSLSFFGVQFIKLPGTLRPGFIICKIVGQRDRDFQELSNIFPVYLKKQNNDKKANEGLFQNHVQGLLFSELQR